MIGQTNAQVKGSGDIILVSPSPFYNAANINIKDGATYIVQGSISSLSCSTSEELNIGSVVRFMTGNDLSLELPEVKWANGVVPIIEPNTEYELSLTTSKVTQVLLGVLTPFKQIS